MRCFALSDVAGPSNLVLIGGWIVLFFIVGILIIIASVFVIRAELKHVKKINEASATAESGAAVTAQSGAADVAEPGNAGIEKAEADKAKE